MLLPFFLDVRGRSTSYFLKSTPCNFACVVPFFFTPSRSPPPHSDCSPAYATEREFVFNSLFCFQCCCSLTFFLSSCLPFLPASLIGSLLFHRLFDQIVRRTPRHFRFLRGSLFDRPPLFFPYPLHPLFPSSVRGFCLCPIDGAGTAAVRF